MNALLPRLRRGTVVAVLALVLLLITLGRRPVRPVEARAEPERAGVSLRD